MSRWHNSIHLGPFQIRSAAIEFFVHPPRSTSGGVLRMRGARWFRSSGGARVRELMISSLSTVRHSASPLSHARSRIPSPRQYPDLQCPLPQPSAPLCGRTGLGGGSDFSRRLGLNSIGGNTVGCDATTTTTCPAAKSLGLDHLGNLLLAQRSATVKPYPILRCVSMRYRDPTSARRSRRMCSRSPEAATALTRKPVLTGDPRAA
jgi:hypothetical protein